MICCVVQFGSHLSTGSGGHASPDSILRTVSPSLMPVKKPSFSPFCSVDQIRISIHCHVSGINALVCVPGNEVNLFDYPVGKMFSSQGESWGEGVMLLTNPVPFTVK